jgi:hypothetical protein
MGVGCLEGPIEKSAFERASDWAKRAGKTGRRAGKTGFTAEYDGHTRATLPVTQHARTRIAHGAQRALVARDPVTGTPLKTRLRIESMDSLRFSTARAATCFTHRDGFATAMCFARRRSLRRSRNAAIFLPTSALTRCARAPPLLRRKLLRPIRRRRGGRHRSLGQRRTVRRAVTRATSPSQPRAVQLHRSGRPPFAAHAECGRAKRTFHRESSSDACGGFHIRRGEEPVFTGPFALRYRC